MAKKQFIFIMTDTQRKDMVGIYNPDMELHTPNLDKLAMNGLRYERAYTCQPVCGPARSTIFTGTYPHTNGMISNGMSLTQQTKSIGQRLDNKGIHCGYIGKWHLDGGDYFGDGKCPDSWDKDYWYDMRNYMDEMTQEERLQSRVFDSCFKDDGIEETFTYAFKCTEKAIDFMENHKDEDYLLVVSYDEPHHPFLAPKEYFEPFTDKKLFDKKNMKMDILSLPEHIQIWAEKAGQVEGDDTFGLLGCNSFVDHEIGRLMDCIEESASDALVVYTSDHGDSLNSHGIHMKGPAMYEEITNIPLIIKNPQINRRNEVSFEATSHIDIVPTMMDYFNVEVPKSMYGKSLLDEWNGAKSDSDGQNDSRAYIEFTRYEVDHDGFGGYQPIRCVVEGDYKLVINLMTQDELYHLGEDPEELNNLILNVNHVKTRNRLHDEILNWMNETRDPYRGYYWEQRPWRGDARKATWDYTGMTRQRITEAGEVKQLDYSTGYEIAEFVRVK